VSLRDDPADVIAQARDAEGKHGTSRADYIAADNAVRLLGRRGIGAWVTAAEPEDGQEVIIDVSGDLLRAFYDFDGKQFNASHGGADIYGLDQIFGWMALP